MKNKTLTSLENTFMLKRSSGLRATLLWFACVAVLAPLAYAGQLDISGPAGSGVFGTSVTVLPNGNFVVTDADFTPPGGALKAGAAYLYSPVGTLISTFTGSTASDAVGSGGVVLPPRRLAR
jgi:hypothetical protein